MVRCFKCEKVIESASWKEGDDDTQTWECPMGVAFSGGGNFGSALYDAVLDGRYVEIVVCDDCVKAAQGTERIREVVNEKWAKHMEEMTEKYMERMYGKDKKVPGIPGSS